MEASVNSSHNDSIYFKMKSVITEIDKYLIARTEDSIFLINRRLQSFSVTIDINVFDPDTSLGAKFFVSLYNLFTKIEPQSQTSWYCVDVLCNASRNSTARKALITTYNFIPSLSRLLCDQLSEAKKKKLLKLMQDLSCGIKISWQFPELPHLLKKLTQWVETQEEQIVSLSLGILVNLSYKNLPVVYTLSRSVDIKKFLRFCLPLRGPVIEIHVCKLMVILDYMHTDIPKDTLIKFIEPTFLSIFEAFKSNDSILLRQIVDFFLDVINQSREKHILKDYEPCGEQIEKLLQLVDNSVGSSSGDSSSSSRDEPNPECVSVILEFIHSILLHDIESITKLHLKITKLAVNWVNSEWVSVQALLVLAEIVEKTPATTNNEIFQSLSKALPSFLLILQSNAVPSNMRGFRRLGALMRLLRGTLQTSELRTGVMQALKEESVAKVFEPLQSDGLSGECLPFLKWDDKGVASTDAVDAYLNGVALVVDLARYGADWMRLKGVLIENRKIHMIVAQAINSGPNDTQTLALEVYKHSDISTKKVVSTMRHFQPVPSESKESKTRAAFETSFPALSFAQMQRLDDTLDQLKKSLNENDVGNIATSQLMELYEYKLARMGYAEKSALESVAASTERCVQLQHQLAQIVTEQNKMQQLLFHKQLCLEQTNRAKEDFKELYVQEQNRAQAAFGKIKVFEGQVKNKDKMLRDFEVRLKESEKQIRELSEMVEKLQEQLGKKEQVISKLVESGNKSEKNFQKTDELLKKALAENKNLNLHISGLEERLEIKEMKFAELTEQYKHVKQILDTITKVATDSQLPNSKSRE